MEWRVDESSANLLASRAPPFRPVLVWRAQSSTTPGCVANRLPTSRPPWGRARRRATVRAPARPTPRHLGSIRHSADRTAWRRLAGPRAAGPLIAYVFHPKFWPIPTTSPPITLCITRRSPEAWRSGNALELALNRGEPGSAAGRRAVAAENSWGRVWMSLKLSFRRLHRDR